jgi:hypothetical protein
MIFRLIVDRIINPSKHIAATLSLVAQNPVALSLVEEVVPKPEVQYSSIEER